MASAAAFIPIDRPAQIAGQIAVIIMVAAGVHLTVILLRRGAARLLESRIGSYSKVQTLTGFIASSLVFVLYFAVVGFILSVVGIDPTTYLASATVIGLAVSFGAQGLVQDVISGVTIMVADLVDVGDMVDVSGQVGVVRRVGIRYLVLVDFHGATVSIPNRNVANVVNYRAGYIRAYVDLRAPGGAAPGAVAALQTAAEDAFRQFSGAMLLAPTVGALPAEGDLAPILRAKFRIWPGQTQVIEGPVRQSLLAVMRGFDSAYPDWAAAVHYRAEPEGARVPLPRPAAVLARRAPEEDERQIEDT